MEERRSIVSQLNVDFEVALAVDQEKVTKLDLHDAKIPCLKENNHIDKHCVFQTAIKVKECRKQVHVDSVSAVLLLLRT